MSLLDVGYGEMEGIEEAQTYAELLFDDAYQQSNQPSLPADIDQDWEDPQAPIELSDAYQQSEAVLRAIETDLEWPTEDLDSDVELTADSGPVVANVAQLARANYAEEAEQEPEAPYDVIVLDDAYQQVQGSAQGNDDVAERQDFEDEEDFFDHFSNEDQPAVVDDSWTDWDEPYVEDGVPDELQRADVAQLGRPVDSEPWDFDPQEDAEYPPDEFALINQPAPQGALDDAWSDWDEGYVEDGFDTDLRLGDVVDGVADPWSDWDEAYVEDGAPDSSAIDDGARCPDDLDIELGEEYAEDGVRDGEVLIDITSVTVTFDDPWTDWDEAYVEDGTPDEDARGPDPRDADRDVEQWDLTAEDTEPLLDDTPVADSPGPAEDPWTDWDEPAVEELITDEILGTNAPPTLEDPFSEWDESYVEEGVADEFQLLDPLPPQVEDAWDWSEPQPDDLDWGAQDEYALINVLPVDPVQPNDEALDWAVQESYDGWEDDFALVDFTPPMPLNFADIIWVRAPQSAQPLAAGTLPSGTFYQSVGDKLWYGIVWADWLANRWECNTPVTVGQTLRPTVATGYQYVCSQAGQTGANEPAWPTYLSGSVLDGSAVWTATTLDETSLEDTVVTSNWVADSPIALSGASKTDTMAFVLIDTSACSAGTDYNVTDTIDTTDTQQKVGKLLIKVR